jgi:hypothetical protein
VYINACRSSGRVSVIVVLLKLAECVEKFWGNSPLSNFTKIHSVVLALFVVIYRYKDRLT